MEKVRKGNIDSILIIEGLISISQEPQQGFPLKFISVLSWLAKEEKKKNKFLSYSSEA